MPQPFQNRARRRLNLDVLQNLEVFGQCVVEESFDHAALDDLCEELPVFVLAPLAEHERRTVLVLIPRLTRVVVLLRNLRQLQSPRLRVRLNVPRIRYRQPANQLLICFANKAALHLCLVAFGSAGQIAGHVSHLRLLQVWIENREPAVGQLRREEEVRIGSQIHGRGLLRLPREPVRLDRVALGIDLELQQHGVLVSGNQSELADLLPALVVHLGVFIDDDDVGFQEVFRFAFELLGKGQDLWLRVFDDGIQYRQLFLGVRVAKRLQSRQRLRDVTSLRLSCREYFTDGLSKILLGGDRIPP